MKLGTHTERQLAKTIHDIVARPETHLRSPSLPSLEAYFAGMQAAFRAEHGRDAFADSPWNAWGAFAARQGYSRQGAFLGIHAESPDDAAAWKRFLAYFNRYRAWAQQRSCTALLENARTVAAARRFFAEHAEKVPRSRLGAQAYVVGSGRRYDAIVFRTHAWLEDEADGRDNRMAIAIVDGA